MDMSNVNRDAVLSYLRGSLQAATATFSASSTLDNSKRVESIMRATAIAHTLRPADFDELAKVPMSFVVDTINKMAPDDVMKPPAQLPEPRKEALYRDRGNQPTSEIPKRDPESRRDMGSLASGPMTGTDNGGAGSIPRRSPGLSNPPAPEMRDTPERVEDDIRRAAERHGQRDTLDAIRDRNEASRSTFDGDPPIGFSEAERHDPPGSFSSDGMSKTND